MIRDLDDKGHRFLLVTSSLSSLPCRLFLVAFSLLSHLTRFLARLGALCSVSCRSPLFLLQRFDGPDCESSHWWCGVNGRRSCCRLIRMILVERADKLSEVLDR